MTDKERTRRATEIIGLARSHGISLATAESCTAGAVAQLLAQGEGASDIFHGGFITYTKANKTAALGVPVDLLDRCSAVSAEVAASMAAGALLRCPADIVLSVSGVMGPEPDEDRNPVGLVYLALASRRGAPIEERHHFPDASPGEVRDAILMRTLELLPRGSSDRADCSSRSDLRRYVLPASRSDDQQTGPAPKRVDLSVAPE